MKTRRVIILGGYGSFGRYISEMLASEPGAAVVIAGRQPALGQPFAKSLGVEYRQCDTRDLDSLRRAIGDAWLVINASGPFDAVNYDVPKTCLHAGCHYIDLADGRQYVAGIVELDEAARAHEVCVCAGASTTPAITSALVRKLQSEMGDLRSIRVALNAGNKNQAGVSTIATILGYVGRPLKVWRDSNWVLLNGWSQGEFVEFPSPVGRRRVQLCDVPDLQLFPDEFSVENVEFKAGVELTALNYAIALMGGLKRIAPFVQLPAFAKLLVRLSVLFKPFGTLHGGCGVWLTDHQGLQKSLAIVARKNGPRIPGSPAILLARKWLRDDVLQYGAMPCMGMVELHEFVDFLSPFDIFLARGQNGNWINSE